VIAVAGCAVFAAGCGSGGSSSERAFATKADRICRSERARLAAIPRPGLVIAVKPFLDRALPVLQRQRREVAALDGADSGEAKTLLARWDDVLSAARGAGKASASGDDARVALALKATHRAKLAADDAARDAGADGCTGFSPFEYQKR
jgi:hypothetical protein